MATTTPTTTAQARLDLSRARRVIERGIDDRLHLGAQLYVATAQGIVADLSIGDSRPGRAMRNDDLVLWLSSSKPVTAVAIMQLVESGTLHLDDPVARHIPQFAAHGKDAITVRHLLTHTAGLRAAAMNTSGVPWDEVIAEICAARIEPRWVPGKTAGYHASSSWYLLGELVQRLSGIEFAKYVRERIFMPLEMRDSWIGMPAEQFRAYGQRITPIFDTSGGGMDQEKFSNTEAGVTLPRPGANGRGPMRELGRFYEMLHHGGGLNGARLLTSDSVRQMIARQRQGMHDKTFNHVMDWGLGFILGSNEYGEDSVPYGYGPYASRDTFGHSGSQSSCAFCDPRRGLVVAWMFNGTPGEPAHQRRQRALNAAIYEDLHLTGM